MISALLVAFGYPQAYRPDVRMTVSALVVFGALALGVSLVLWRARREASYASRILRAAQIGSGLGLPCLLLWPSSASSAAETYIKVVLPVALLAMINTPFLLLGLLLESILRREPRKG